MGSLSTFGTFTMARLGIYVSQHALNVTGNNISNINTKGYSRQELDQTAMSVGGADRYQSRFDIRENGGVMASGVDQTRDKYLDIRYRNEQTRVGTMDKKLEGLDKLAVIFDEVGKGQDEEGVLEARFNDFIQQVQTLNTQGAGQDDFDSLVRKSAEALTTQFNDYAKQLETLYETEKMEFKDTLDSVNTTLKKIRNLNESIRMSEAFGGTALTQKDERNLLIDQLSELVGINVIYEKEMVGEGVEVDKLKITLADDNNPNTTGKTLIDGIYGAQLQLVQTEDDTLKTVSDEDFNNADIYSLFNFDLGVSQLWDSNGNLDPLQSKPNQADVDADNVTSSYEELSRVKNDIETAESGLWKALEGKALSGELKVWTLSTSAKANALTKALNERLEDGSVNGAGEYEVRHEEGMPEGQYLIRYYPDKNNKDAFNYPNISYTKKAYGDTGEAVGADKAAQHNKETADAILTSLGAGYSKEEVGEGSGKYVIKKDSDSTYPVIQENYIEYKKAATGTVNQPSAEEKMWASIRSDVKTWTFDNPTDAQAFQDALNEQFGKTAPSDPANPTAGNYYHVTHEDWMPANTYVVHYHNDDATPEAIKSNYSYVNVKEDKLTKLGDNELSGGLQAMRELLTEKGEYATDDDVKLDPDAGVKRGIPYYSKALDTLARTFAETMNEANRMDDQTIYQMNDDADHTFVGKDGSSIASTLVDGKYVIANEEDRSKLVLKNEYNYYDGGVLFSNSANTNDGTGITAANISISHSWDRGFVHMLRSKEPDSPSRANENLAHFVTLLKDDHTFSYGANSQGISEFKGTFQEMLTDTIAGTLGKDQNITRTMLDNYNATKEELYVDRDAVMGVDLNDEAMNMMQFQKAYSAACRLMTTYDAMLDKLINGMAM